MSTHKDRTYSLEVLAGMLESGRIDTVYFACHSRNHCAVLDLTPHDLRVMSQGDHIMASVREIHYESTGRTKVRLNQHSRSRK